MTTKKTTSKKRGAPKGKPQQSYTQEQKAICRAHYENESMSIPQISERYNIPIPTLNKWSTVQKWEKGKFIDLFNKTQAEKNIEMFAELGKTPKDFAQRVADGAFQDRIAIRDLKKHLTELLVNNGVEADNVTACVSEVVDLFKECGDLAGKSLGWVQEANKLMGTYAPTKRELTGADGAPIGGAMFVDIPEDELNERIAEHIKKLGLIKR